MRSFVEDLCRFLHISLISEVICVWLIIHDLFIHPFILVGVLRNYMKAGLADSPTEASFSELG